MTGNIFGAYRRVSTKRQGESGLGLEAQEVAVKSHVASHGGRLVATFTEVESGTHSDRPQLAAALSACSAVSRRASTTWASERDGAASGRPKPFASSWLRRARGGQRGSGRAPGRAPRTGAVTRGCEAGTTGQHPLSGTDGGGGNGDELVHGPPSRRHMTPARQRTATKLVYARADRHAVTGL